MSRVLRAAEPDPCTGCRSLTAEERCRKMATPQGALAANASRYHPGLDCVGRELRAPAQDAPRPARPVPAAPMMPLFMAARGGL